MLIGVADDKKGNEVVGVADWKSLLENIPNLMRDTMGMIADVKHVRKDGKDIDEIFAQSRGPGDIMVRVGAAPDAIVADQAKSDGPINGPINGPIKMRVLQFVREHAGCKLADIANGIGVSLRSLKRALEGLSAEIQYRGSKKTGGYFPRA